MPRPTILMLNQTYPPDPSGAGQYVADVAGALARRGYRVRVLTADRGHDDPSARYLRRELLEGVEVSRVPFSALGTSSILRRVAAATAFLLYSARAMLSMGEQGVVVFTSSPPLVGLAAAAARALARVPAVYWIMDLNIEQAIATGAAGPTLAGLLRAAHRVVVRSAVRRIVLDRFMEQRLLGLDPGVRVLDVLPPWPQQSRVTPLLRDDNPFRVTHGFGDRLVIMYAGNHSPCHPLTTLLQAALQLRDADGLVFVFVGGGRSRSEVDAHVRRHGLTNVRTLPYQPLAALGPMLSAADLHVVSMGDDMVGLVHPSKVYNVMAAERPVLYVGPAGSPIAELVDTYGIGWRVAHGDVAAAVQAILAAQAAGPGGLAAVGARSRDMLLGELSETSLLDRFCEIVAQVLQEGAQADAPRRARPRP